jgi:predicted Zn-dependent protease
MKKQFYYTFKLIYANYLLIFSIGLFLGCSTNPATGERHLNLISESREIQIGKDADQQITAALGLYPGEQLQNYVNRLGQQMAARSERPNLPWTFRVVDDPVVNAFALPGGFVYITRGILSHLNNQDQLEGVLGHEIGHITAKHSVYRISSQQITQIGLGIAMIVKPELQQFSDIANLGLGLMYLKFGRDDEREADMLGVRYMSMVNSNPRELAGVMKVLDNVSQQQGGGRIPEWLSTHPDPGNRVSLINRHIDTLTNAPANPPQTDEYLSMLDGMIYGENPREGYFRGNQFFHPELQFSFSFPQGWRMINQKQAVIGISGNEDALIQISLTEGTPDAAARRFLGQQGIQSSGVQSTTINGLQAATGNFSANTEQGSLSGSAVFISHGNNVYQILGYSAANNWRNYQGAVTNSFNSFNRVTDQAVLNVQPQRLKIITASQNSSIQQLIQQHNIPVPAETIALINQMEVNAQVQTGQKIKIVEGNKIQ